MRRKIFAERKIIACFAILLSIFLSAGVGMCEEKYGYEEKDKGEEQARFIKKLKENKD